MSRVTVVHFQLLPLEENDHYRSIHDSEPSLYVAPGIVRHGLLGGDTVEAGAFTFESSGERITQATADALFQEDVEASIRSEYLIRFHGGRVLINASYYEGEGCYANNSCSPNAPFMTVRLNGSEYDIVMLESITSIPCDTEVLVSNGCL